MVDRDLNVFEGKRVLHFAPERAIRDYISSRAPDNYVTVDLYAEAVDCKENVENLALSDGSFDVVIASHLLEHVDDRKALAEIHRVLSDGGCAVLMFPIIEAWDSTYENEAAHTPRDRELHFGQNDHVRYYGRDVRERIARAGFFLKEYTAVEPAVRKHALVRGEKVFLATRSLIRPDDGLGNDCG